MGLGLGKNSKPVMGMGFLMGSDIFLGFGFGMAKPDGFRPVAIPSCHRSCAHPSLQMNLYWKLRMDWFASQSSLMKRKVFILRRGWVDKYSFPSWFKLRIVLMAHRVTHPLSLWGYEHSRVTLSGDQATHTMSMMFLSATSQILGHPWYLLDPSFVVAKSLWAVWSS